MNRDDSFVNNRQDRHLQKVNGIRFVAEMTQGDKAPPGRALDQYTPEHQEGGRDPIVKEAVKGVTVGIVAIDRHVPGRKRQPAAGQHDAR